jgi:sugar phosphate permease
MWTCHQYFGNITAALLASFILYNDQSIPWEIVFLIPAVISFIWAIFILYNLPEKPEHVHELTITTTTTDENAPNTSDYLDKNTSAKAPYQVS